MLQHFRKALGWHKHMALYDVKRLREFLWAPSKRVSARNALIAGNDTFAM